MTRELHHRAPQGTYCIKSTLPRPGDVAELPNTETQAQGVPVNRRRLRSMSQRKTRIKLQKNNMETSNLPETEFEH